MRVSIHGSIRVDKNITSGSITVPKTAGIVPDQQRAFWAPGGVVRQVPVQHKGEDGVDSSKVVVVVFHQTLLFHHFHSGVQDVGFRLKLITQLQTVVPRVVAKTHGKDPVDDGGGASDRGDAVAGLEGGTWKGQWKGQ